MNEDQDRSGLVEGMGLLEQLTPLVRRAAPLPSPPTPATEDDPDASDLPTR
jgi:hypothetical protein